MLHALALAGLLASPPAPIDAPAAQLKDACQIASIDPSFVRYVPPAIHASGGNPLLWWVSSAPQQHFGFGPRPHLDCVRPIQVRDDR